MEYVRQTGAHRRKRLVQSTAQVSIMIKYKIKDIAFECDEKTGRSRTIIADRITEYSNPIEGFNSFWGSAGYQLLEEVRDKIAANGFDRWTGERNKP